MIATLLVDVDHLLANPIYDPSRCSIGFHPLHQLWFIVAYMALCFVPKVRLIGIGLIVHMALDTIDCQITSGVWINQTLQAVLTDRPYQGHLACLPANRFIIPI